MLKWVADENFNNDIVRGLLRRNPDLDIVRVQDISLSGEDDPTILEWAAQEGRVMLTHDFETVPNHAHERIKVGHRMPGTFQVRRDVPLGKVIEDILLIASCSLDGEWENQICYLPLK